MASTPQRLTQEWLYASRDWDIERLVVDIGIAKKRLKPKSKGLSPTEVTFLCLLLCERRPQTIAHKLRRDPNGVKVDLSKGLYSYIEELIGKRPVDWREIIIWLEQRGYKTTQSLTPAPPTETLINTYQNGEDAVEVSIFYGRTEELSTLKQWILDNRCRLVVLLGMAGIGKTSLSMNLTQQIHTQVEYVIWRSLPKAPSLIEILADLIQFRSDAQNTNLPKDIDINHQILLLTQYLYQHRYLMILIRDKVNREKRDQEAYKNYSGELIPRKLVIISH
jgi:hypothetical protein